MANKIVRNGRTAVVYSPGYGAGWTTCVNAPPKVKFRAMTDPELVQAVLDKRTNDVITRIKKLFVSGGLTGVNDLAVMWIPEGTKFRIIEDDGSESIEFIDKIKFFVA